MMNNQLKGTLIKTAIGVGGVLMCLTIAYSSGMFEGMMGGASQKPSAALMEENSLGNFNPRAPKDDEEDTIPKLLTEESAIELKELEGNRRKRYNDSLARAQNISPITDVTLYNNGPGVELNNRSTGQVTEKLSAYTKAKKNEEEPSENYSPVQVRKKNPVTVKVSGREPLKQDKKKRRHDRDLVEISNESNLEQNIETQKKSRLVSKGTSNSKPFRVIEVPAIVYGQQHIMNGNKATFMLTEPMELNEGTLDVGTLIDASCAINDKTMNLTFSFVRVNGKRINVNGLVFDSRGESFVMEHSDDGQAVGAHVGQNILNRTLSKVGLGDVAQGTSMYEQRRLSNMYVDFNGDEKVIIRVEQLEQ